MNRSTVISTLGLVGALAVSGFGQDTIAQGALAVGGRRSNNGGIRNLAPGFLPDPQRVAIVSGGNLDVRAMNLGPGCVGYATRQPDVIYRLTGPSASLRFYVQAASDTTLVINTANGGWRCNDDSYGGTNPTVDLANAAPGQYDIWIGSYQAGTQARGQLFVTELDHHP